VALLLDIYCVGAVATKKPAEAGFLGWFGNKAFPAPLSLKRLENKRHRWRL